MTRKSRLSTAWQQLAPEFDRLIQTKLSLGDTEEVRSHSRVLACWWIRLMHAANFHKDSLAHFSLNKQLTGAFSSLYALFVEQVEAHVAGKSVHSSLRELGDLAKSRVLLAGDPPPTPLDIVNRVHELLLWLETPNERRSRGAYYTSQAVAKVLVDLAHERLLQMTLDGAGLWSPASRVLDFAAGTGAFFGAASQAGPTLMNPARKRGHQLWLSSELNPETHAIGLFCMACDSTDSETADLPRYECADALSHPEIAPIGDPNSFRPFNVIIGNPPYSALRGSEAAWLNELLRGYDPFDGSPRANYHATEKQTTQNRKHSLGDDYVRFLRLAHWHIERAGQGVIALILNHGILENTSFRGLRKTLAEYFDDILFLDLHGNAKRRELTPTGGRDESVFNIEQGTMIAILSKWPSARAKRMQIGHIYGLRDEKIAKIISRDWENELQDVAPTPPQFFFHSQRRAASRLEQAYFAAPSLAVIMPLHSTAIVTARDAFVVDCNLERLQERIAALHDLTITDEAIRDAYFPARNHAKHAPGDTRGWRLDQARRKLVDEGENAVQFVGHWYRPWDWRWLAYSKHLIDWRRERFTPLLLGGDNLSLIARRQSPPGAECNYVWTTNTIVLDGILRSDNRGTEFVFPLYRETGATGARNFNFLRSFADNASNALGLCEKSLFQAIVAILHGKTYQTTFRDELCRDFPKILLPGDAVTAAELAAIGKQIIEIECMSTSPLPNCDAFPFDGTDSFIARGFPKYRGNEIWINDSWSWKNVPEHLWSLRAGAHQPIRRWLKQRQGTTLSRTEIPHASRMLTATTALLQMQRQLDELLPTPEALERWT